MSIDALHNHHITAPPHTFQPPVYLFENLINWLILGFVTLSPAPHCPLPPARPSLR